MNYSAITPCDVNNGPGCRVSLFLQGCKIRCPGCFNSELWDFNGGKKFIWSREGFELLELLKPDYISGLSILGGEPLDQSGIELMVLINKIKNHFPNKTIWVYTGHTWEDLDEYQLKSISNADVLVDGPFIQDLKDASLAFRGSSNQRLIDIQKSISSNQVILWE